MREHSGSTVIQSQVSSITSVAVDEVSTNCAKHLDHEASISIKPR